MHESKDLDIVIKSIYYYTINMKYILVTNIVIKKMGRNLSGEIFIGVFYTEETFAIIILLSLFGNFFFWNGVNGGLMISYSNLWHITTVFRLQSTINIYG